MCTFVISVPSAFDAFLLSRWSLGTSSAVPRDHFLNSVPRLHPWQDQDLMRCTWSADHVEWISDIIVQIDLQMPFSLLKISVGPKRQSPGIWCGFPRCPPAPAWHKRGPALRFGTRPLRTPRPAARTCLLWERTLTVSTPAQRACHWYVILECCFMRAGVRCPLPYQVVGAAPPPGRRPTRASLGHSLGMRVGAHTRY